MIEMISRRLTKEQKAEILEAYKSGDNTNVLAEKYNCTSNTINRTVKTLLSDSEYKLLKKYRTKSTNRNGKYKDNENVKENKENLDKENSFISFKEIVNEEDLDLIASEETHSTEIEENEELGLYETDHFRKDLFSENLNKNTQDNDQSVNNDFKEIAPLISGFDFNLEKQKSDFEVLNYKSLPESVYMIVDKKVELDLQPISDLPEWSFLPENELKRNAILLFSNQRSAKRICSRNQRVIKIPNTSVFKLSKSYLISKGITRLILEDSIIGLED